MITSLEFLGYFFLKLLQDSLQKLFQALILKFILGSSLLIRSGIKQELLLRISPGAYPGVLLRKPLENSSEIPSEIYSKTYSGISPLLLLEISAGIPAKCLGIL